MFARLSLVAATAWLALCVGCHKATIETYRIPKEKDAEFPMASGGGDSTNPATPAGGSMAGASVPTAEGADLTWTAPADWTPKPPSPMRKGSYEVPGNVDLSITAFPGDVGGELANVNRWRGQVQLPPVTEAELPAQVARAQHDGLEFDIVDYASTGPNGQRILGAMVPFGGATWFFKLIGPADAVEKAKPGFLALLESVKAPANATAAVPNSAVPAPTASAQTAVPTAAGAALTWTAPTAWQEKPAGDVRRGSYRVPGPNGQDGDVSVTAFPGDVGGELANVNRWRGQVQLPPITEADLAGQISHSQQDGLQLTVVDVAGPGDDASRILGAIVPFGGSTWFFKLVGPKTVVESAKPAFLELLKSIKPAAPTAAVP